jgi:hypothetical protein
MIIALKNDNFTKQTHNNIKSKNQILDFITPLLKIKF